jgi:hypothetical protein
VHDASDLLDKAERLSWDVPGEELREGGKRGGKERGGVIRIVYN